MRGVLKESFFVKDGLEALHPFLHAIPKLLWTM